MALELIIHEEQVTIPQAIENLEALKAELAPRLEKYNSLVVTEDGIKAAKNDKAALNKLRKAIEERRIDAKKQVLSYYEPLEAQCKEIVALIDAPIQAIDRQVKVFEDKEKEQKYNELLAYFNEINDFDYVEFKDVLPSNWTNKTETIIKVKASITGKLGQIRKDYDEIFDMYGTSPLWTAILNKFKETLEKSPVLVYAVTLERQYKQEQERKAAEAEAQRAAETASTSEPAEISIEVPQETQSHDNGAPVSAESVPAMERVFTGRFEVTGTKEQIKALGAFMKSQGIKYTIIK